MADFATTYLGSFVNYEHHILPSHSAAFHLRRVKRLLRILKDPQRSYPVIHIVGTKGKGSTAIFLASILREAGLKVGLYTSPHLYDLKERIRILKPRAVSTQTKDVFEGKISTPALTKILKDIRPAVNSVHRQKGLGPLTFFEVLTAAAFSFFAQENVDVAVVEAGLGGRLDATNVSKTDICVLTSISLDHTAQLGKTLSRIACEKSAVIKSSTQAVFSASQAPQARATIQRVARKYQVPVFEVGRNIDYRILKQDSCKTFFSLKVQQKRWPKLQSSLLGSHQVMNASLAASVAQYFLAAQGIDSQQAVARGMAYAIWPGRCEILRRSPFVVADSAHNRDSMKKILHAIKTLFPRQRIFVIFGASKDKDIQAMLEILTPDAQAICLTQSSHPRSFDFMRTRQDFLAQQKRPEIFSTATDCASALKSFLKKAKRRDIILATGSVFIASEIRKICLHNI